MLVNGLPGSGKSTLAPPLARELDAQLLSKDAVKEALAECISRPDAVPSLGAIAMEAVWAMAAAIPQAAVHNDGLRSVRDWDTWAAHGRPLELTPVINVDTTRPTNTASLAAEIETTAAAVPPTALAHPPARGQRTEELG